MASSKTVSYPLTPRYAPHRFPAHRLKKQFHSFWGKAGADAEFGNSLFLAEYADGFIIDNELMQDQTGGDLFDGPAQPWRLHEGLDLWRSNPKPGAVPEPWGNDQESIPWWNTPQGSQEATDSGAVGCAGAQPVGGGEAAERVQAGGPCPKTAIYQSKTLEIRLTGSFRSGG